MENQIPHKGIATLVVEDEEGIRFFLKETLEQIGHQVTTAVNGEEALTLLREMQFDLVMLDLHLGGRADGIKVLEAAKWRWPEIIVIILTAHGSLETAMTAIQEGINGYLLKPVSPAEVRQVVNEAIGKQKPIAAAAQAAPPSTLQWEGLSVNLDKHHVEMNGERVDLTASEFKLLAFLMEFKSQVHSPQKLVLVTRGYDSDDKHESKEIVKWYIHRLRKKLESNPADPKYILNVRGVGYTFGEKDS
ncbi:MAG: response regulator transcription factor [Chloroflexota bacterium]